MDIRRRIKPVVDQENLFARTKVVENKTKVRHLTRVLGDNNTILQNNANINAGKVNNLIQDFDKKAAITSKLKIPRYQNVSAKIDTGLVSNIARPTIKPTVRPPLRKIESQPKPLIRPDNKKEIKEGKAIEPKEDRIQFTKQAKSNGSVSDNLPEQVSDKSVKEEWKEIRNTKELLEPKERSLYDPRDDIRDIDANDDKCLYLVPNYVKDIYCYLRQLETRNVIKPHFLANHTHISGKMRSILADWILEIHSHFSLYEETFQLTISIVDRYLQETPQCKTSEIQLVGIAAVFIASKYEEIYCPDIHDLVFISEKAYSKAQVLAMEKKILKKLDFLLTTPYPLHFLRRFSKAASSSASTHDLGKYFLDLLLIDYGTAHYRPSMLAAAAVCLSNFLLPKHSEPLLNLQDFWTSNIIHYTGYTFQEIKPVVCLLACIVYNRKDSSRYQSATKKYSRSALHSVAKLSQLDHPIIKELATNLSPTKKALLTTAS